MKMGHQPVFGSNLNDSGGGFGPADRFIGRDQLYRDVICHSQVRSCCSFVCFWDAALKLAQYIVLLARNKEHQIILGKRILSWISSSLMAGDLVLVRKKLSRAGLCGLACSLAHILLGSLRFCLRCLHGHGEQMVRHSAACCSLGGIKSSFGDA